MLLLPADQTTMNSRILPAKEICLLGQQPGLARAPRPTEQNIGLRSGHGLDQLGVSSYAIVSGIEARPSGGEYGVLGCLDGWLHSITFLGINITNIDYEIYTPLKFFIPHLKLFYVPTRLDAR